MHPQPIDLAALASVHGGASSAPRPPVQPVQPSGMAPPKYSAAWWDLARASGNIR